MKTIIISTIFFLLFSAGLYSQNKNNVRLETSELEDGGMKKEYIQLDRKGAKDVSKVVYIYSPSGQCTERIFSMWNNRAGWEHSQKHEYTYSASGKLATIIHTRWDKSSGDWQRTSDLLTHVYDENDNLKSVIKSEKMDAGLYYTQLRK
ncbi:MAG: DUF3836 domain-containing protein [Dysgonomonas sp.]|nr:DUF3836 domain-containing protein [Dysgonomonas sp.]